MLRVFRIEEVHHTCCPLNFTFFFEDTKNLCTTTNKSIGQIKWNQLTANEMNYQLATIEIAK